MANIYLQLIDGTIEVRTVSAGSDSNHGVLDQAPRLPLVVDPRRFAKTLYTVVKDTNGLAPQLFVVAEKEYKSRLTYRILAQNFDSRYYTNDADTPSETDVQVWTP